MSGSANFTDPEVLRSKSRAIHGHMYVLPVAAWILKCGTEVVGVSEAIAGLGGSADRPRVIEALVKLVDLGALREMPRAGLPRNAPRMFERVASPYWTFAEAEVRGSEEGAWRGEIEAVREP